MNFPGTQLVFVYGSLKTGFSNNRLLKNDRSFLLGEAVSLDSNYLMVGGNVPAIDVSDDHEYSAKVKGEVWLVGQEILEGALDYLEGHPFIYCREEKSFLLEGCVEVSCWVYLRPLPSDVNPRINLLNENGEYEW